MPIPLLGTSESGVDAKLASSMVRVLAWKPLADRSQGNVPVNLGLDLLELENCIHPLRHLIGGISHRQPNRLQSVSNDERIDRVHRPRLDHRKNMPLGAGDPNTLPAVLPAGLQGLVTGAGRHRAATRHARRS